ncbi:nuclear transport factor 2 family protein [Streptomyces anulatus]
MSAPAGQETDPGKILFERFVDLWNGEVDFADTADFIADEFTVHSAELARYLGFPDSNHITTRDGLLDWVRAVRGLLHDVRFTTDPGPIRDGDHVAGGYTVTGTYAGGAPTEMQDQIEEFKIPRRCVVLDALPLSRNGKVDRKELTALLEERARPSSVGKG